MENHAIIYNPKAGKGSETKTDIEYACKCLDTLDVSYKLFETEYAGHAIELANKLAKDGYRIIGAGGDGTCNEVMNGVITSKSNVLCGFIPMGTGNDIPGAIGIRPDIKELVKLLLKGIATNLISGWQRPTKALNVIFLG